MNVCSKCLWTDEDQELALLTDNISPAELMDYDELGFIALLIRTTADLGLPTISLEELDGAGRAEGEV